MFFVGLLQLLLIAKVTIQLYNNGRSDSGYSHAAMALLASVFVADDVLR